ncbi:MAG: PQQ-binding-like beta-propeller repeat protein [Ruminococcaceae bacterium]|nr:PQQ-binding-like beta-propeller repeat protein [Oscillospiraceae bacterium]
MTTRKGIYVKDGRYHGRKKSKNRPGGPLLKLAAALVVVTLVIALIQYGPGLLKPRATEPLQSQNPSLSMTDGTSQNTTSQDPTDPDPTPIPTPTPVPGAGNPQLLPPDDQPLLQQGQPATGLTPADNKLAYDIFGDQMQHLDSFERANPIALLDPLGYQQIPGVLTFRGNNFRNAPAYGLTDIRENILSQDWSVGIGGLPSSSWSFSWTGTGWTGQPLLVQWDDAVRNIMNIRPEKKEKADLVEVIYATMDGKIYFLDLDDGQPTRDPINVGATIKGTPCIDPRGYPVLYVGQGDKNSKEDIGMGFRVFNLIDQSLLLYRDCTQDPSHRSSWAACDSSPIFDAVADTLIYPNENGMVYTVLMNTDFDLENARLTIDPEFAAYRYKRPDMVLQGIESSMAVYNHYGYYSDNSGMFHCLNINTLEPVWVRQLKDDSDVTPVLRHEGDQLAIYTGTEVDWQKGIVGEYQGDAYVYKMNALTGEVLWENSLPCWTRKAANIGDDINGGIMGSPLTGKQSIADLVIFSFTMTNGMYSGTSLVAFNQADGAIVWEYKMAAYSWSSPVDLYDEQGNAYIVMADSAGKLHLVDGKTGEQLHVLQLTLNNGSTAGNIESSCAVFGNRLVVGTRGQVIAGVEIR